MNINLIDEIPQELVYTIINYLSESDLYNFIDSTDVVKLRFESDNEWMKLVYQNEPGVTLNPKLTYKQNYLLFRYPEYYLYDIKENKIIEDWDGNFKPIEYSIIDGKLIEKYANGIPYKINKNYGYLVGIRPISRHQVILTNQVIQNKDSKSVRTLSEPITNQMILNKDSKSVRTESEPITNQVILNDNIVINETFIYIGGYNYTIIKVIGLNDLIIKVSKYLDKCFILTDKHDIYYSEIKFDPIVNTTNPVNWGIKAIDIEFKRNVIFFVSLDKKLYYFNIYDMVPNEPTNVKILNLDTTIEKIFVFSTLMFIDSYNKIYLIADIFNPESPNHLNLGSLEGYYGTNLIEFQYDQVYIEGRKF